MAADFARELILDHYRNPRNHGTLDDADATFEDSNPLCGDRVRIDLKLDGSRIADIRFSGRG
jgi:nitrogen fixation NifU-like protein